MSHHAKAPCAGCDLVSEELATIGQVLVGARNRERWDMVDTAIDRLRELARHASRRSDPHVRRYVLAELE